MKKIVICTVGIRDIINKFMKFLKKTSYWSNYLNEEIELIFKRDPAIKSKFEVFLYSGFQCILIYRISHYFYKREKFLVARIISQIGRALTGIEIHPGAQIGKGLFIDHGSGVVIGETTIIGNNVIIYQGVTLGGTGKEKGRRHPIIGDGVLIGTGAKVLGPFKVGEYSKIGAGSVVLNSVPAHSTVVGIPARVVGKSFNNDDLDQVNIPDPIKNDIEEIRKELDELKKIIIKE